MKLFWVFICASCIASAGLGDTIIRGGVLSEGLQPNDTRAASLDRLTHMSNVWVDASGNVGINTNGPLSYGLVVKGKNLAVDRTADDGAEINVRGSSATFGFYNGGGTFSIRNSSTGTKYLSVPVGTGNVGIGTNLPATPLDVNGAATVRGNLYVTNGMLVMAGIPTTTNGFTVSGSVWSSNNMLSVWIKP